MIEIFAAYVIFLLQSIAYADCPVLPSELMLLLHCLLHMLTLLHIIWCIAAMHMQKAVQEAEQGRREAF